MGKVSHVSNDQYIEFDYILYVPPVKSLCDEPTYRMIELSIVVLICIPKKYSQDYVDAAMIMLIDALGVTVQLCRQVCGVALSVYPHWARYPEPPWHRGPWHCLKC